MPVIRALSKRQEITAVGEDVEKGNSGKLLCKSKSMHSLWNTVAKFFNKSELELSCDPMIPPLDICPKELKLKSQRNTSTTMFIATLFTIANIWERHKCPPTD